MTQFAFVHSYRGGSGKSTVAANVAALLAAEGRRVGLVDSNFQAPGVHHLFGLTDPLPTLNDYLHGTATIAEAAHDVTDRLAPAAVPEGAALYLVPSNIKASEIARILREGYDVGRLNDGFRELSSALDLDFLIVDTHPGLNEETLLSITVSDVLILLMRPDKQDFQGTAVTVDVARRLDVPQLLLLVNKVPSSVDREALGRDVAAAYDSEVGGVLPLSEAVVENSSGSLFSLTSPEEDWSITLAALASRIAGRS